MEATTKSHVAVKRAKMLARMAFDEIRSAGSIHRIEECFQRSREVTRLMFTTTLERRQYWLELQLRINAILVGSQKQDTSGSIAADDEAQNVTLMNQAFSLIWHELYGNTR